MTQVLALRRRMSRLRLHIPSQRGLTRAMREDAQKNGDPDRVQVWFGQVARLARAEPAWLKFRLN
jgi:hypothetical protein